MPCNCDYMNPDEYEIEHAKVEAFLEELDTNILPKYYNNPENSKIYGKTNKNILNLAVSDLCEKLTSIDVKNYSLELQIWWRDHQIADKKRIAEEDKINKLLIVKRKALNKLTDEEKSVLGLI